MKRKSNIELLRIILFFMVVSVHAVSPYLSHKTDVYTLGWVFSNMLDGVSRVCVNCYVIISGYFFVSQNEFSSSKRIKRLLSPMVFYLPLYFYLFFRDTVGNMNFFDRIIRAFSKMILDFLKSEGYFYHLWYVQVLIVLIIFIPYINILLHRLSKAEYKKWLMTLTILVSVVPTIGYLLDYEFLNLGFFISKLSLFIYLYSIGGYLKIYPIKVNNIHRFAFITVIALLMIGAMNFLYNSRTSPLIFIKGLYGEPPAYPFVGFVGTFFAYDNLLVVMASVLLFTLFLNINIRNMTINSISSTTYGAYLGHVFVMNIHIKAIELIEIGPRRYVLDVSVYIFLVAVMSILIEKGRLFLLAN